MLIRIKYSPNVIQYFYSFEIFKLKKIKVKFFKKYDTKDNTTQKDNEFEIITWEIIKYI